MTKRLTAARLRAMAPLARLAAIGVLGVMVAGCNTVPEGQSLLTGFGGEQTGSIGDAPQAAPKDAAAARDYWATAYAKNPHDEKAVIAYARALKADGSKDKAMSVLQQGAIYSSDSKPIAGEEGRLALDMGQDDLAGKLLARANDPANPDWRVLNALGTLEAHRTNRAGAQGYFERAAQLAPNQPAVLNNLALSYALGGDPAKAEGLLRKAMTLGGDSAKIRQNLALVLGLQGRLDEAEQLSAADLGNDKAKANRAYLQKMVAATPIALGRPPKANPAAIAGAWQTAIDTHPQPAPSKPADSASSAWLVDVANAGTGQAPAGALPWALPPGRVANR